MARASRLETGRQRERRSYRRRQSNVLYCRKLQQLKTSEDLSGSSKISMDSCLIRDQSVTRVQREHIGSSPATLKKKPKQTRAKIRNVFRSSLTIESWLGTTLATQLIIVDLDACQVIERAPNSKEVIKLCKEHRCLVSTFKHRVIARTGRCPENTTKHSSFLRHFCLTYSEDNNGIYTSD